MNEVLLTALSWLTKLALWVAFFTRPAYDSMLAIIVLVFVDLIVGVWAAKKRGERITSYGLRRTVMTKIVPYQIGVLSAHIVEQQFLPGIPLMKALAGFVSVAELKSISENLGEITGLDLWNVIREKLQPVKRSEHNEPEKK